jgi:ferritin
MKTKKSKLPFFLPSEDGKDGELQPIETDEEWAMIEEILNTFLEEERGRRRRINLLSKGGMMKNHSTFFFVSNSCIINVR